MMVSKNSIDSEKQIIKRGRAYLTPMLDYHVEEFEHIMHSSNKLEIKDFGYHSVNQALSEIFNDTESYVCRNKYGNIVFVGGLSFLEESPQMFTIFANSLEHNVILTAKMSKALLNMFDKLHPIITMTILSKNEHMLNWACWLGFEPIEMSNDNRFVEFVRCNSEQDDVYNKLLRPVVH